MGIHVFDMNMHEHTVAIDVMGSDRGPEELIAGVVDAFNLGISGRITLVGDEKIIRSCLSSYGMDNQSTIDVLHASEVISMDDKPILSLRKKKDSSLVRALELVKDKRADAVLSCGNTGSLMAGSTLRLRPMAGVERPALATIIPTLHKYIVLLDVGANPNTTPMQMVHNAILGSDYCKKVLNYICPRVGLLTIGTEEGKGNDLINSAHMLLKKTNKFINYIGLIEGFQIFDDQVDVVVCDGFVGNILLKTLESLVKSLKTYIKSEVMKNPLRIFGACCMRGVFSSLRDRLSPEEYGAASLLGLNGVVLKAHGSSDAKSISSAVRMAFSILSSSASSDCIRDVLAQKAYL